MVLYMFAGLHDEHHIYVLFFVYLPLQIQCIFIG